MNDPRQATVLFVDDEERILRTLNILFRPLCRVLVTTDPQEALRLVEEQRIDVVVSDQRMPQMLGAELLASVRERSPDTVRILLTGYSDLDAAIDAVNDGGIWRYVNKPWTVDGIQKTVREAVAVALAQRAAAFEAPVATESRPGASACEILVIDSEPHSAAAVRGIVGSARPVHEATNLTQAVELLGKRPIGVVVTEATVNGDDMTHLLHTLKQNYPDVVGIVVTAMRDTPRLIRLINQAQVFRYMPKPLRPGMLARSLEASIARHQEARRSVAAVPAALRVEEAASEAERTLSQRIGSYLARLRARPAAAATG